MAQAVLVNFEIRIHLLEDREMERNNVPRRQGEGRGQKGSAIEVINCFAHDESPKKQKSVNSGCASPLVGHHSTTETGSQQRPQTGYPSPALFQCIFN